jgi:hypothetical protein
LVWKSQLASGVVSAGVNLLRFYEGLVCTGHYALSASVDGHGLIDTLYISLGTLALLVAAESVYSPVLRLRERVEVAAGNLEDFFVF